MESNYLKSTVGPVLAKAVAETVIAQPGNPQEYLALYLLHHIQQERRKEEEQRTKAKTEALLHDFDEVQAQMEKAAADLIQRKFRGFREKIRENREREAERWSWYEESTAEAEELLENLPELKSNQEGGNEDEKPAGPPGEISLQEKTEKLEEARRSFYTEQRFIYRYMNKTLLGELKNELQSKRDIILRGMAESVKLSEVEAQREDDALDVEYDPLHREPNLPAAARELVEDLLTGAHKTMNGSEPLRLNFPLVLFRTLRCLCYLLFNASPKATDTPEKVFQLLKPTQLSGLIKAFNPVATYHTNTPLKLESEIMKYNKDFSPEEGGEAKEGEPEGEPVPQPKARQVRRVSRLMRFLFSNAEYYCDLLPSDFLGEEMIEEEEEGGKWRQEQEEAEKVREFLQKLKETITNEIKDKHKVALYSLVKYIDAAVRFRRARDAWVDAIRNGTDPNAAHYEVPEDFEAPEDEAEDENNEEALVDEEGEPDMVQIQSLLHKLGEDKEEKTVKIWENRDGRRKKELIEFAIGYNKTRKANEDDEEDEEA